MPTTQHHSDTRAFPSQDNEVGYSEVQIYWMVVRDADGDAPYIEMKGWQYDKESNTVQPLGDPDGWTLNIYMPKGK